MNPTQAMDESRRNLNSAHNYLTRLRDKHPVIYSQLWETYMVLLERQQIGEAMYRQPTEEDKFGLAFLPLLVIGGTVSAVGWKGFDWLRHREDTSQFNNYLECVATMTTQFELEGLSSTVAAEKATGVCKGQGLMALDWKGILQWGLIGSGVLLGLYLWFK
jgi:hypothetical protein